MNCVCESPVLFLIRCVCVGGWNGSDGAMGEGWLFYFGLRHPVSLWFVVWWCVALSFSLILSVGRSKHAGTEVCRPPKRWHRHLNESVVMCLSPSSVSELLVRLRWTNSESERFLCSVWSAAGFGEVPLRGEGDGHAAVHAVRHAGEGSASGVQPERRDAHQTRPVLRSGGRTTTAGNCSRLEISFFSLFKT